MSVVSVSELDLSGKPSVQTSIEHTTEKGHYLISSMIESGPLEFTITGSGDEYLDLSSAYLHLTASISVGGVTNPTEDDKVAPVNNWVQSLFSQVDVSLNGKVVSSSSNTYVRQLTGGNDWLHTRRRVQANETTTSRRNG